MVWNPEEYLSFASERERPARDLVSHIVSNRPGSIADLGCGPGNSTELLRARWPLADIYGVDNSPQMLKRARASHADAIWIKSDVATWRPPKPMDMIFSNSTLQWLDNHQALFPRLMSHLSASGVLAVQMPRNFNAPSHLLLREVARAGPWAKRTIPLLREDPVLPPVFYYDLLAPLSKLVEVWQTDYLQLLDGHNPVLEWVKGTALVQILDTLDDDQKTQYLTVLGDRLLAAYPRRADGKTIFPFRRIFIVAYR